MAVKVAINGFGRIGRLALRLMAEQTDKFEVVANEKEMKAEKISSRTIHLLRELPEAGK